MFDKKLLLNRLEEELGIDSNHLSGTEEFNQIDGWDSLMLVGLIAMIDEHYNLQISTEELGNCKSINDFILLVESKTAEI
jgi:acyl carrier protein